MSNHDVSYFKVKDDDTEYAFNDADAEVRIDDLDSEKAPIENPSLTWDIGSTGSATLRRGGAEGDRILRIAVKATSTSSEEHNNVINSDGSRNWVTPDEAGALADLTTTAKGNLVAAINELDSGLDTLNSNKAPSSDPTLTWPIGTSGNAELRKSGSSGSYAVSFVTKATSSSPNVFNALINSDGSRNWIVPKMKTKTLSSQTTSSTGSIDLGLTISAAAVLGCMNASYLSIPFVYSGGWRVRVVDNSGARVASTNVGDITVYYLEL